MPERLDRALPCVAGYEMPCLAAGRPVLWDNRSVVHRRCRYDLSRVRNMQRTTVLDPASVFERDCTETAEAA